MRIASQLCQALECIHAHRIVHADIKPENILCVPGTVDSGFDAVLIKLVDFGSSIIIAGTLGDAEEPFRATYVQSSEFPAFHACNHVPKAHLPFTASHHRTP